MTNNTQRHGDKHRTAKCTARSHHVFVDLLLPASGYRTLASAYIYIKTIIFACYLPTFIITKLNYYSPARPPPD